MTFQPSLTQTIPIYYFQHWESTEYSPNCIVRVTSRLFGLFPPTILDYSIPSTWTIGIQGYVDPDPWIRRSPSIPYPTPRSIFRRSIPRESVVRIHSYPTLVENKAG